MKVLVFDTETTGLPEKRNTSILETEKWPYIVQISWIEYDTEKDSYEMEDHIIDCGVDIPQESVNIHGISKKISERKGENLWEVMNKFDAALINCDMVIGHNISFDKRVYMVEAIRNKRRQYFTRDGVRKPEYCTMKKSKELCNIMKTNSKGETYLKYPSLSELHDKLFGFVPKGTHDSMADVLICLRCFVMLEGKCDITKSNRNFKRIYELYCGNC